MEVNMKVSAAASWCCVMLGVSVTMSAAAKYVTGLITTVHSPSPVYTLPTWESPLTVFGVMAESDVDLILLHPSQATNVTISIQRSDLNSETQLTNYWQDPAGSESVVTRDKVYLTPHNYTWFAVYRRDSFIGLFAEEEVRLILAYTQEKGKKLNFLDYTEFRVQSYYDAVWDFVGSEYKGLGEGPGYPEVVREVQSAGKGLVHRLMMLEQVLDAKPLHRMPHTTKATFFAHLKRIEAYIFLCRFYGFDFVKHVGRFFPWRRLKAAFKEMHRVKAQRQPARHSDSWRQHGQEQAGQWAFDA